MREFWMHEIILFIVDIGTISTIVHVGSIAPIHVYTAQMASTILYVLTIMLAMLT